MKPSHHCIPCHVHHMHRVVSSLALQAEDKYSLLRELTHIIAHAAVASPPDTAFHLYQKIEERTGVRDPFAEIKKQSNAEMLSLLPQLHCLLKEGDTLRQALKIALAANSIDYGIGGHAGVVHHCDDLKKIAGDCFLPIDFYSRFLESIKTSQAILYIADNAGEIVADMLVAELLPREKIIFAVRGGPVINDATMDDANQIGLIEKVKVITTGDRTPGINVHRSSGEFLQELLKADMIILKGQGNFETMIDIPLDGFVKRGADLFFMFKVKCRPVAEHTHKQIGDSAFILRTL